MHFIYGLVFCITNANLIQGVSLMYNITDILTSLLSNTKNQKIDELKTKLKTINHYTIDNDKLTQILFNVTKESSLNETNFFKALSENDHFRFLLDNDHKNLYLKMKEKLNRDDFMKILAESENKTGKETESVKNARKYMRNDEFLREDVNEVVDKMIAAEPADDHKFKENESIYWDPQGELYDRHEFHQHSARRLYKGERTTVRYYPFMASVHVMGRFWCGGVIYWHDLVLTSAACLQLMHNNRFFRENPKVLEVRFGSNHSRIGGETIHGLEVYFHPAYNPKTLQNNIAVIRLRRHLHFNYHRIPKVIDISHRDTSMPATAEVLLLGWGVTKMSQKVEYEPIYLQRKFLPVYPNHFCKEIYGDKFITNTMFCAGTFTTGEGACDHDAGGPAILNGKLVGIISFGPTICGYPNAPTVFTLVGAFADWIETVNETMPGYYRNMKRTTTSTQDPLLEFFENWDSKQVSESPTVPPFVPTTGTKEPVPTDYQPPGLLRLMGDDRNQYRVKNKGDSHHRHKPKPYETDGLSIGDD